MSQTQEQKRAQDAWVKSERYNKEQRVISKRLPALIINSGLIQVAAFCEGKGGNYKVVCDDLRDWLQKSTLCNTPKLPEKDFIELLVSLAPSEYQEVTAETFSWLKWLRQMAEARSGAEQEEAK